MKWLLVVALLASTAHAQVFKKRDTKTQTAKKSDTSSDSADSSDTPKPTKKKVQAKKAPNKKGKKAPKEEFCEITDDDDSD